MKSIWKLLSIGLLSGMMCSTFTATANAQTWNRKTYITTNQPIEIPGNMVLPAGEYTIKLLDLASSRSVVEFFSRDEQHLYNTVMAIPTYQLEPAKKTELTFYEAPAGTPHAVRTWITQGSINGLEFLYSRDREKELAMMRNTPATSMEATLAPATEPSQLDGNGDSSDGVATASTVAVPATDTVAEAAPMDGVDGDNETAALEPQAKVPDVTTPASTDNDQSSDAPNLPKTAGIQELLLLVGMGSTAGAFAIRRFRQ